MAKNIMLLQKRQISNTTQHFFWEIKLSIFSFVTHHLYFINLNFDKCNKY